MAFDLSNIDVEQLIKKIVEEVVATIEYSDSKDENVSGTVALFTSFVPSKRTCGDYLKKHFGTGIQCALFNGVEFSAPGCFTFEVKDEHDEAELFQLISGAADIVLVTPKLTQLYKLAEGNDEGYIEQAFLRPLLWGRRVTLLLDFETPKFKRATFFAKVVEAIDILTNMGVKVIAYRPAQEFGEVVREALVTENEVKAAYDVGSMRVLCEKDAISTALARDKANELGVSIDF